MNIYELISDCPFLTFFVIYIIAHLIFKVINRFFRSRNIKNQGWPPEHCDADGDFKPSEE